MGKINPRPKRCIHARPSTKSIIFCGVFINISSLHLLSGLSIPYLSLIFAHKRNPSLDAAERIAMSLGMGLESFLVALRGHKRINYNSKLATAKRTHERNMMAHGYRAYARKPV
jgi:hypothetical protein